MEEPLQFTVIFAFFLVLIAVGIGLFVCVGLADVFQLESCHWFLGVVLTVVKAVMGLFGQ